MDASPERLKIVPKPQTTYSILSVEDIQQWAQGHYPDEEKKEEQSAVLDDHGQPVNRFYNHNRLTDRVVDEMLGLCKGVVADGVVNEKEAQFLMDWISVNRGTAEQWPANVLYRRLAEMLIDHCLDQTEQAELLSLLQQIATGGKPPEAYVANLSTSLPLTRPAPAIYFSQRHFCFTGRFILGPRKQCEGVILAKGGIAQKVPTGETDYLVIGILGSRDWIHSTHGRKIEKAVEFQGRGYSVAIVSEEHWMRYIS
jgi:hypothetical protein